MSLMQDTTKRALSFALSVLMIISMLPLSVFAVTVTSSSTLTTDIGQKSFVVGTATEFTFTTTANSDEDTMVRGSFVFSDPSAIATLEYKESQDGNWYEFSGDFGPENGFPMSDATSQFRVTFNKAGIYTVDAYIKAVDDGTVLCSTSETVKVEGRSSLSTDIESKTFVVDENTEFSFTTMANEDVGTLVIGSFAFSDPNAIATLEYKESQDGNWYAFDGDFGPVTGFPMTNNATSHFRATFNKTGTYTLTVYMKSVETGDTLCFTVATVTVKGRAELSFTDDNIEIKYGDVNATNSTLVDNAAGSEYIYESDNEGVVKVNKYGILTPVSLGQAKITVTRKENSEYVPTSASYNVTVVAGVQGELIWDKSVPETIKWNDPDGYINTVSGGSGIGSVTYTSNNTDVAEVNPTTGELSLKKPGTVTITATKDGGTLYDDQTASYTLVVAKAEQSHLEFDEKNPNAIYYGDEYTNVASGGSISGEIKYTSSDVTVATVDGSGKVTALKQGVVQITVTLEGNDYYEDATSATYTLTIYRAPQKSPLVFEKGTNGQTINFGEEYTNAVISGGDTAPVKYSSSEESIATVNSETGAVTALKAGTVTITATAPETDQYEAQTLSYELVIELADQTVVFEKGNTNISAITYGDSYQNKAFATTEISYVSSDDTVAEVDNEGNLIIHKADTVTITATAKKTEQYAEASESYTITINKADQVISFDKDENPEVTFNDNENKFSNPASSTATNGDDEDKKDIDILYNIASGKEFVDMDSFNPETGEFTINGAGTIIVNVSFSTNDRYKANLASYTLVVKKDDQKIFFDKGSYEMTNGDNSFESPVITTDGPGTGTTAYSVKEDKNNVISKIDPATGELTFAGNTGFVVILATKIEDANYNSTTAEYALTVNEWIPPEDYFKLSGDTLNDSGWYTGNVGIVAQDGYVLSYERVEGQANWLDTLIEAVTEDGTHVVKFYVKNIESGLISNLQSVEIKKDATDPIAQINHEKLTGWEKFISIITLGLWEPEEMNFAIDKDDVTSGVAKVEYYVVEGTTDIMDEAALDAVDKWEEYNGSIPVGKDKTFVVYAKVTDTAGNHIYASTNGIVFDRTAIPEENIVVDILTQDYRGFYNESVEFNVRISDAQPSSGINKVYYEVFNNNELTQGGPVDGILYQFAVENPTYEQLVSAWNSADYGKNIIVDAEKNNSDNVVVKITVVDNAGNEATTKEIKLKICTNKPTIDVSYFGGFDVDGLEIGDPTAIETFENVTYYDASRIAKIVITGRTSVFTASDAAEFAINQTKGDTVNGSTYEVVNWETTEVPGKPDAATHTYLIKFNGSANYDFTVDYTDIFGNNLNHESNKFAVDHDLPTASVTINEDNVWTRLLETLTFGLWKNSAVTVKASAADATSPVRSVEYYKSNANTAAAKAELEGLSWVPYEEFDITKDEQFAIYLKVTDRAGHIAYICSDGYIIDMTLTEDNIDITPDEPNENGIYGGDFDVRIDVEDMEPYSGIKTVEYWVTCNGTETIHKTLYSFEYVRDEGDNSNGGHLIIKELDDKGELVTVLDKANNGEIYVPAQSDLKASFSKTITVDAQANNSDHVFVFVKVVDNAGNEKTVQSKELKVDVVAPKIDVSFDVNNANVVNGRYYFNSDRVAKIVFTERTTSFDREKATAGIVFSGVDRNGQTVTLDRSVMIKWDPTIEIEGDPDAATHTAYVSFTNNANYDFSISYTDQAGHPCEYDDVIFANGTVAPRYFTVDKEPPNIKIKYSDSFESKCISMLTLGFYSLENPLTVTISTEDNLALEKIEYTVTGVKGKYDGADASFGATVDLTSNTADASMKIDVSTKKNDAGDIVSAEIKFNVPAEFKGKIEAIAYDCAGNKSEEKNNDKKYDEVIVDSIAPKINISYKAKDAENTNVRFVDANNSDVKSFDQANQALYNGDVNATITIKENNFFEGEPYTDENGYPTGEIVHEVGVLVTKTDNDGVSTTTEYLPAGASKRFKDADRTVEVIWDTKGNVHKYTIPYDKDADYVITVKYVDFSGNEADIVEYVDFSDNEADIAENDGKTSKNTYTSKIVTVDKTAPIVKVEYKNKDIRATYGERQYYIADQFATITVEEHNFRADDFKAVVTAKYSDNTDVSVEDFAAKLSDDSKWTKNGNTYTIELNYTVDANYTFDYTYEDLAHNPAIKYVADEFTVDKVDPENLTVTYDGDVKTTILDKVLNVITFGYYNAKVKVTISAYDTISCIDHFVYSYIKADGVSNVNASLENEVITSITQNGKTFSGTFEIPKAALQNTNQFNGTVKFTAYERSTRNAEHKEAAVIIVDNIAPTATITFNDPVQKVNDVSYYAGNIDSKIVINEANFYSQDVQVVVTKNDANYPVKVTWTDNSIDVHTGTFTLTEDGDYKVTVNYADRSKNEMTPYASNQLTIDTKEPVITVSDVKHQSANNEETISFIISVTDINIPLENVKPILNAVIKKDNGNNSFTYETKSIALGNATTTTNANGEIVHSYTVSNLEADGYYSLVCTAVDYASHSVSIINAAADEGGNSTVETMNFSVNREGSVFWIETEHNDKYTNETFTDKLNGTYANDKVVIKLHEINVDKVDENADKRTVFTLNDGSKSEDIVLKENENYSKNVVVGTGGWYETIYTLDNNTFDHDGVYSLNVITYDKAGNSNVNTKTEAGSISFTLDRTRPMISANVRTNQSVRDTQFWVNFDITETNLDAETIMVKLTNNGETLETKVEDLGNNEYKFLVESGYNYSIEIVAKDLAGNESELYKVEHFTVSTNIFILWYANTPLFWGSIGGTVLLTVLIIMLILLKKRKNREEK